MYCQIAICAVLLNTGKINEVGDGGNSDNILIHITIHLDAKTITAFGVFCNAVLAHVSTFAAFRSAAQAEEIAFVFTLVGVGAANAKKTSRNHCVSPTRVDSRAADRRALHGGVCDSGQGSGVRAGDCATNTISGGGNGIEGFGRVGVFVFSGVYSAIEVELVG